jgi:hypothetical protein
LIGQSIVSHDFASDMWIELKERFAQVDRVRIYTLQIDIYSFKQGNLDVTDYYTELKVLWEELANYRPLPTCSCYVRCRCDAVENARSYRVEDHVIRFLMGLNDEYVAI